MGQEEYVMYVWMEGIRFINFCMYDALWSNLKQQIAFYGRGKGPANVEVPAEASISS